ncbi:MAG: type II secretion system F family protein [Actinomycetota bacterium]|nr:type II secretion system F family protein [Actinomycetota bacterium]
MIGFDPLTLVAALSSAFLAAALVRVLIPPPRRLSTRVRPYVTPSISTTAGPAPSGVIGAIFGPIIRDAAHWLGGMLDRGGKPVTLVRLRQAGWFQGLPETEMLTAYRLVQLRTLTVTLLVSVVFGQVVGASITVRLALAGLGLVIGSTRTRGRLDRAIEDRREMMRIEVYTVNQLLAMRVRAGGGVIQAVKATTTRGRGAVVDELNEALRLHRAGWSGPDAFRRIAEISPEPFCSRTYRLLASAEERGADLGQALLALSEDVRETRRESVKRTATKRRAAMLLPTIAILAPVLILFVAAPLPYLITSWQ